MTDRIPGPRFWRPVCLPEAIDGDAYRRLVALSTKVITRAIVSIFVLCGLGLSTEIFSQTPAQTPGRTWALVIGISQYPKLPGGQQLQDSENDARAFANVLQQASGVDLQHIWLLVGQGATQTAIKTGLGSWLAHQSSEEDTVYIFFSGHGVVEHDFGSAYWLAYDSDPKNIDATAISFDDLKRALSSRIKAKRVFIIADCLRRDFFEPETTGPADVAAYERAFTDLAQSRPGLTCLVASGPNEFSREGRRWKDLGVFTRFLVDGMSGRADKNKDGSVTDEELFDFLAEHLPQETSEKQHPWRTPNSSSPMAIATPHLRPGGAAQNAVPGPVAQQQDKHAKSPTFGAGQTGQKSVSQPAQQNTNSVSESARSAASGPAAPKSETSLAAEHTDRAPTNSRQANSSAASSESHPPASPAPVSASVAEAKNPVAASVGEAKNPAASPPASPLAGRHQPAGPPEITSVPAVVGRSKTSEGPPPTINSSVAPAPSPVPAQFEEAIAAGRLIDPKGDNAWDLYQRFGPEFSASDLLKFKDRLAAALLDASKKILVANMLQDTIKSRPDDIKRAGKMLSRLNQLRPDDPSMGQLQKLEEIENLIALEFYQDAEKLLAQTPSPAAAPLENARGIVYVGELSEWQAERSFKRAIEADPAWAAPHYNLGLLYKSQGKDTALAEFEQAAKLAPASSLILAGLGDEYFEQSRWADAANAFSQAIVNDPNNDVLHTKLGHALYSEGKHQEADLEYRIAREIASKNH